jgi:hypothetical protein
VGVCAWSSRRNSGSGELCGTECCMYIATQLVLHLDPEDGGSIAHNHAV